MKDTHRILFCEAFSHANFVFYIAAIVLGSFNFANI